MSRVLASTEALMPRPTAVERTQKRFTAVLRLLKQLKTELYRNGADEDLVKEASFRLRAAAYEAKKAKCMALQAMKNMMKLRRQMKAQSAEHRRTAKRLEWMEKKDMQ